MTWGSLWIIQPSLNPAYVPQHPQAHLAEKNFFSFTFFLCSVNLFTTKRTTIIVLFFVNKLLLPISPGPLSWIWLKTKTNVTQFLTLSFPMGQKAQFGGGGGGALYRKDVKAKHERTLLICLATFKD